MNAFVNPVVGLPLSGYARPLAAARRRGVADGWGAVSSRACATPPGPQADELRQVGKRATSGNGTGHNGTRHNGTGHNGTGNGVADFTIVSHKPIFQRYQTVYQRDIRYPSGQTVSFDVLGNARSDFKSVFVFPFDTRTGTATMIREYAPGRNREQLSFVAGMFEGGKHDDLEAAARAELSEEALLTGGRLMTLTEGGTGVSADKYSMNEFFYFLGIDCERDAKPARRDDEEWISVVEGVGLREVRAMIRGGLLNTPNSLLGLLALEKLRDMGYES